MKKTKIWRVHAEKVAEDLWQRMRCNESFDVLCDPELNEEFVADCQEFIRMAVAALGETFEVVEDDLDDYDPRELHDALDHVDNEKEDMQ